MKNKIVVIGSSNVDMIMKMERLPRIGETIADAEFLQTYGGKGANQAIGSVRAGGNVAFVNCVGDDAFTPQMLKNFKADELDIRFVFQEEGISSGYALVMIGDQGNNYLSVAPGANYRLIPARIDEAMPVIEESAMILMQYEIPEQTIKYVFDIAKEKNIPVLWNFAPARSFNLSYIGETAILIVNETEAEFLCGFPVESNEEVEKAGQHLLRMGAKLVIITLGKRGSFALSLIDKIYVPAFNVDVVDTTAAGDVFCGSFAVAQVEGKSLKDALVFASAASALCVTKMGAQPSAPTRNEIEKFLNHEQQE
ncbi:ribokinase [Maribellus comscasis]|uniref:Ribokinase n=1 Tax=Maribellus comscasis TaxID=2681766 RepID=A0A6I6K2B4_9BACT|nr:ribokinase [Maribellus comscasis]QGY47540.1 ribokinase [Maribellus comscasis]